MTAGQAVPSKLEFVPLSECALRLHLRYQAALDWLLVGRLVGEKRNGRWMVTRESMERAVRAKAEQPATTPAA